MVPLQGNTKNNSLELLMAMKEFLDEYFFYLQSQVVLELTRCNSAAFHVNKVELKIKV